MSGRLLWRPIEAPDFRGSMQGIGIAADSINRAFAGLSTGLDKFDAARRLEAENAVLNRAADFTDPAALKAAIADGRVFGDVNRNLVGREALGALDQRAGRLLDQTAAQQNIDFATQANPLRIDNLRLGNEGAQLTNAGRALENSVNARTADARVETANLQPTVARAGLDQTRAQTANTVLQGDTIRLGQIQTNDEIQNNRNKQDEDRAVADVAAQLPGASPSRQRAIIEAASLTPTARARLMGANPGLYTPEALAAAQSVSPVERGTAPAREPRMNPGELIRSSTGGTQAPPAAQIMAGIPPGQQQAAQALLTRVGQTSPEVAQFLANGPSGLDPTRLAWCAAAINTALRSAGIEGSGSNVATSFARYGIAVSDPTKTGQGDIVLLSRGRAEGQTGGHVGFATGNTRMQNGRLQIEMVAGNEGGRGPAGNRIGQSWVNASEATIRRPPAVPTSAVPAAPVAIGPASGALAVAATATLATPPAPTPVATTTAAPTRGEPTVPTDPIVSLLTDVRRRGQEVDARLTDMNRLLGQANAGGAADYDALATSRSSLSEVANGLVSEASFKGMDAPRIRNELSAIIARDPRRINPAMAGRILADNVTGERSDTWLNPFSDVGYRPTINQSGIDESVRVARGGQSAQAADASRMLTEDIQSVTNARTTYQEAATAFAAQTRAATSSVNARAELPEYKLRMDRAEAALQATLARVSDRRANYEPSANSRGRVASDNSGRVQNPFNEPRPRPTRELPLNFFP